MLLIQRIKYLNCVCGGGVYFYMSIPSSIQDSLSDMEPCRVLIGGTFLHVVFSVLFSQFKALMHCFCIVSLF